jgi:hypothetical protein
MRSGSSSPAARRTSMGPYATSPPAACSSKHGSPRTWPWTSRFGSPCRARSALLRRWCGASSNTEPRVWIRPIGGVHQPHRHPTGPHRAAGLHPGATRARPRSPASLTPTVPCQRLGLRWLRRGRVASHAISPPYSSANSANPSVTSLIRSNPKRFWGKRTNTAQPAWGCNRLVRDTRTCASWSRMTRRATSFAACRVGIRNRAAISMITGASATADDVAIHRRC